MTLTVDAIYEDGVLKPTGPLPFEEHEKVTITVQPAISLAAENGWNGPLGWRRHNA